MLLITGGTGTFGAQLVLECLRQYHSEIILLIRASSDIEAKKRIAQVIKPEDWSQNIQVYPVDLTQDFLGLSQKTHSYLLDEVTHILHAAAATRFNHPITTARLSNVQTTKNMVLFAKSCKKLKRFGHISSAFVAGKRTGTIREDELLHKHGFINTYQQSKYEAEVLVQQCSSLLPTVIFRPSIIISKSTNKDQNPFSALHLGIHLVKQGFLPLLPGKETNTLDIIEESSAAKTVIQIFLKKKLFHTTYHITCFCASPTVGSILMYIEKRLGKKIKTEFSGSAEEYAKQLQEKLRFRPDLQLVYKKTSVFLPELAYAKQFDNHNTVQEIGRSFTEKSIFSLLPI